MGKPIKRSIVFCEPCGFKKVILEGSTQDMFDIKTSPIPGGAPYYDNELKKTITRKVTSQNKKFKCPKCGRGVTVKALPESYLKAFAEIDELGRQKHEEREKELRILDGRSHVKSTSGGEDRMDRSVEKTPLSERYRAETFEILE